MPESVPLKALYDAAVIEFPQYDHRPEVFQQHILDFLKKDPIRTSSVRRYISADGLGFELHRSFPLNDFLGGTSEYLRLLGISQEDAAKFERKYHENNLLFR